MDFFRKPQKESLKPKQVLHQSTSLNSQTMKTNFDEEDDVGTSTIPDLSLPSKDEEEEVKSSNV